jgi:hypothetical protein
MGNHWGWFEFVGLLVKRTQPQTTLETWEGIHGWRLWAWWRIVYVLLEGWGRVKYMSRKADSSILTHPTILGEEIFFPISLTSAFKLVICSAQWEEMSVTCFLPGKKPLQAVFYLC